MREVLIATVLLFLPAVNGIAADEDLYPVLKLKDLLQRAEAENHEIAMARKRIDAARYRIPQASALPDPMFMIGYENEGWNRYTYGEMAGSRWIFSASQTIPWPGKLSTQKKASLKESEGLVESYKKTRLSVFEELKTRYYELLYAYKGYDISEEKIRIFEIVEEIASTRYASGMMPSVADITMAQSEKYMAFQERIMFKQKIESLKAMINALIGRSPELPLGRPEETIEEEPNIPEDLIKMALEHSPEIKEKERVLEWSTLKLEEARLQYYPDFTITGTVSLKPRPYEDMWDLTASINIPIFYRKKQRMGILEKEAEREEAYHGLLGAKQIVLSNIIETLSMIKASQELMKLYRDAFIPKAEQSLEANLSSYRSGRVELVQVIKSLNRLIDYKLLYWQQVTERQKAIARLERLTGLFLDGGIKGNED